MRVARRSACMWLTVALVAIIPGAAFAADHTGQVTFSGQPVPGATVTAIQGTQRITTFTSEQGAYEFSGLAEGPWTIHVEMLGFASATLDIPSISEPGVVTIPLSLRTFSELSASGTTVRAETIADGAAPVAAAPSTGAAPALTSLSPSTVETTGLPADLAAAAADGFLVNGSVNNGASTPFAQASAFGNNRNLQRSLYNGMFGAVLGNSAWDARPFSFAGTRPPKPSYDDLQILGTFGGPIPLPGPLNRRPNLFAGYQRNVDHTAATQSGIVPTALERAGDFSRSTDAAGRLVTIVDPESGRPFPDARLPPGRLSPEALALLALYPAANVDDDGRHNYQAPVLTRTRQDSLQMRVTQSPNLRHQLLAQLQFQRTQTDTTSIFGFTSANGSSTLDASGTWSRRFSPFLSTRVRYQFTRSGTDVRPHFAGRADISGTAGILGADRAPANWGPPLLTFASGMLPLSDVQYAESSTTTNGVIVEALLNRGRHSLTLGLGTRHIAVDAHGQQNGRGSFTFTGAETGLDLADFLLGLPGSAALAFGNSDKRLRARGLEAYVTDDWRVTPALTINAGVRWDFETPFSEQQDRLSNLDVAAAFSEVSIVTPTANVGSITGRDYPPSLLRSDLTGIQPRLGVAWRPVAGSSLVIRGGYGIYRNTNTYQPIAQLMAQQPPYSRALSIQSTAATPLTLRDGLLSPSSSPVTFGVDPDLRVGSAHNWQVIAQRDLPASLTLSAGYLGSYGSHLMQEFLPNTYPAGSANPCPGCPVGFAYVTSDGSSSRHAGQLQLRRRLRNGLQASAQYTLSTSTDNASAFTGAALSGPAIAQDWRDLEAERGPSSFDQRHLVSAQVQYTTGIGVAGGGLLTGMKGAIIKGWTLTSQVTIGSGLPLTAVYLGVVPGTGVTGTLRASMTGIPVTPLPGYYLNPSAFSAPASGMWGNAGRNSITGPQQFSMTAGIARSFPWGDRASLDWRIDATNVLNVVTYTMIDANVGSPQFGLPTRANPMRKIQTSLRFRF